MTIDDLVYDQDSGIFIWRETGCVAGSLQSGGYRQIKIGGKRYYAHRLAWLFLYGKWPIDQVDHINGNRDDNRAKNLREATGSQNQGNSKCRKHSASGLKGVQFDKNRRMWRAYIKIGHKVKTLGRFDDPNLAHAAYYKAAQEVFGEFARPA